MESIENLRNEVYCEILTTLSLSPKHRSELHARGLFNDDIDILGYRSIENPNVLNDLLSQIHKRIGKKIIQVPGIAFQKNGNLFFISSPGLLLPSRDKSGKIWSLIRKNDEGGSAKYVHISSVGWIDEIKVDPRPHMPLVSKRTDHIIITEGIVKSDIATLRSGSQVVGLHGVATWRRALSVAVDLSIKSVTVAFDMDHKTNRSVFRALVGLYRALILDGYEVTLMNWDKGKGVDDAFQLDAHIENFDIDTGKAYLENVGMVLGFRKLNWDGLIDDEIEIEAENFEPYFDLPSLNVEAPSMLEDFLPQSVRPFIIDNAQRMQVPLEFIASSLVIFFSGLIGRKFRMRPKRLDSFEIVPNLWGAIIGLPSVKKSPAVDTVKRLLDPISDKLNENLKEEEIRAKAEVAVLSSQKKSVEGKLQKAFCGSSSNVATVDALRRELEGIEHAIESASPKKIRLLVNDATVEKLQDLMRDNTNGIIVFRDELYGFLKEMEKPGREGARAFYLECWRGDGKYYVDRIGSGTKYITGLCLSILGTIQPDMLEKYFLDSHGDGYGNDGFFQRFQVLVYPEISKFWEYIDRLPNAEANSQVETIFNRAFEYRTQNSESEIFVFSDSAQELYIAWITDLENRLRQGSKSDSIYISHLAKYGSLMPSLALIFHSLEEFSLGKSISNYRISSEAVTLAIQWCTYLERHALKIYSRMKDVNLLRAHALREKILNGDIRTGITIREIYRKGWEAIQDGDHVYDGLRVLEQFGWIKFVTDRNTGGAPKKIIEINPEVYAKNINH